ncbi:phosphopantetheine-binding protein [[Leptolyngbya] sp. PCC 7376]|uniref:acyl carrier protein n=1 Tax=[Leptolyngbya] sp. PCC 7376 TaxID=111781 RepID=UPI00029F3E18|nr:phosphopantetheine-binding protein [[Leptolyngbya] sp. PCC 7376]AFY40281.1 phosphopantetheine-binding protein [[Leptolyngbya] sp. PCC 7376]
MSDTNQAKLFEILATVAETDVGKVSSEIDLTALGLSSIDVTEVMFEIEEEFLVEFPDQEDITKRFDGLKTVNDLLTIVNTLIAEKEGG